MTVANGQQQRKEFNSFATLQQASQTGELRLRKAPDIEEFVIPNVEDVVIPPVKIQVVDGRSALQMVAEQIKAQKAAKKAAQDKQLELQREAKQQQKAKVRVFIEWMIEGALPGIHDIQTTMNDEKEVGTDLLEGPSPYPRTDGKALTVGQQMDEWRSDIDRKQNHKNPVISLPIIVAEAVFWLSVKPLTPDQLMNELSRLVGKKVLQQSAQGEIRGFHNTRFSLANRFNELDQEYQGELTQEVKVAVENQITRLREELAETERRAAADFMARATIQPIDFFEGKDGICCFLTKSEQGRLEGGLLVHVTKEHVWAIDAFGRHRNGFLTIRDLEEIYGGFRVQINRNTLKNEGGQLRRKDERISFEVPTEVSENDSRPWINSCLFIFHSCRNGILYPGFLPKEMQDHSARPKLKRLYKSTNVVLTPEQFHHDDSSPLGKYVVKLPTWKWRFKEPDGTLSKKETSVTNLELEFERFEDDDGMIRLRIIRFSPEHKEFLERVDCLSPNGYIDDPQNKREHPFFNRVLRTDHAIKFAKK